MKLMTGVRLLFLNWNTTQYTLMRAYIMFFETGISLVDESATPSNVSQVEIAPGIHAAYDLPQEDNEEANPSCETNLSLEELMAQMKTI